MRLTQVETASLRLRPLTMDDVDDVHRLWTDPDVRRYLWDDEVIPKERATSVIKTSVTRFQSDGLGLWAVFLKETDKLIGFSGFWFFHEPPRLQLLYGIAPLYWRQGFATEAAKAMIKYGFENHPFDHIEASTDAPNLASVRVMEKAGMRFQNRVCSNGLDTVYYVVMRSEFEQCSNSPTHIG